MKTIGPDATRPQAMLDWAESGRAAQQVFERLESRSRRAREQEAALIEQLDLEESTPRPLPNNPPPRDYLEEDRGGDGKKEGP